MRTKGKKPTQCPHLWNGHASYFTLQTHVLLESVSCTVIQVRVSRGTDYLDLYSLKFQYYYIFFLSRWDSPLVTITPEMDPNLEALHDYLYLSKPPPPNQSTQTQPLSSTNFLHELDRTTQVRKDAWNKICWKRLFEIYLSEMGEKMFHTERYDEWISVGCKVGQQNICTPLAGSGKNPMNKCFNVSEISRIEE